MIGMSLKEVIELKKVPLVDSYPLEDKLPEDGLFCYCFQPGEEHDGQRKRATCKIWSKAT